MSDRTSLFHNTQWPVAMAAVDHHGGANMMITDEWSPFLDAGTDCTILHSTQLRLYIIFKLSVIFINFLKE